jgi:DNA-binding NarL/FixJ family response regulator
MRHKKLTSEQSIHVVVVESDPLRFAGFRALLGSEDNLELNAVSLSEFGTAPDMDVVLLAKCPNQNLSGIMQQLNLIRPGLRVLVTGQDSHDETVLQVLASGAKGYVDEGAPAADFAQAIQVVHRGLIWAPRRVLAIYIERYGSTGSRVSCGHKSFTSRERQVLKMLVEGRSNKEIAAPLGIRERTVKAHVAKLLRKVGVQNRIMLSVHAINHSLVPPDMSVAGQCV